MLARIRAFFDQRGVLEVETPVLSRFATSELHLSSWLATDTDQTEQPFYLHTSPELFMKRLLADGSGDIYQICKVFRAAEQGARHNPEFTLLEWYRTGHDMAALIEEVEGFFGELLQEHIGKPTLKTTYQQVFVDYLGIDPLQASTTALAACYQADADSPAPMLSDRQDWLDLLLSHRIEPQLPRDRLSIITGFPAEQASLARIDDSDPRVARRFEVYFGGLELANGFEELVDPEEQQQRMQQENRERSAKGLPEVPLDQHFIAALASGLPACSGVAVGLDRVLMAITGIRRIDQVISFDFERV